MSSSGLIHNTHTSERKKLHWEEEQEIKLHRRTFESAAGAEVRPVVDGGARDAA